LVFETGVIEEFEAAHALIGKEFGPASKLHGHTYKVEAKVSGEALSESGVLCDITLLRDALRNELKKFHYNVLNEVPELSGTNTTAEAIAKFIHHGIREKIKETRSIESLTVTVWENEKSYASFAERV
jgi:6-pyruvoyltetrahydropterin/6-carboxytetrahydropterin synthase